MYTDVVKLLHISCSKDARYRLLALRTFSVNWVIIVHILVGNRGISFNGEAVKEGREKYIVLEKIMKGDKISID